ncbi:acyltransferase [Hymenobacter lucidus]|uniref:N-acetyltransferase n=1 Tax=Hymenobacter lucidus TaxID=2880930 RepID=A0ABS8ARU2_9BACT|nr:acyltransferase [Hymenobacter lucidus]MCB2408506.1 N-acetyltransferase [Hymenobacter lucidus]
MPEMNTADYYVHPSSLVETTDIGAGTTVWAFVHLLPGVQVGKNCNICDHCFAEAGVVLGDNVTLKCGIYLWRGTTLEDDVFVGPNVVFTNDLHPRSKNKDFTLLPIVVRKGASLGANSTLLAGTTVGRYALVGSGAVVTHDVPDYALVYGNPARQRGWVDETGEKLLAAEPGLWRSADGQRIYRETSTGLTLDA